MPHVNLVKLEDERATATAHLRELCRKGPIRSLIVANPADLGRKPEGMAVLAPWVAMQRDAALLLTNDAGCNVEEVVHAVLEEQDLRDADAVFLVAGLKAIPTKRRPNPVPGKDAEIEMEPLTPSGTEPHSLAIGRLFH